MMNQGTHEYLTTRLENRQEQMNEIKGNDEQSMRRRAILSVKIASLKSRIRYLDSEVKIYLPEYNIGTIQIPTK